jgi:hypothetical protein
MRVMPGAAIASASSSASLKALPIACALTASINTPASPTKRPTRAARHAKAVWQIWSDAKSLHQDRLANPLAQVTPALDRPSVAAFDIRLGMLDLCNRNGDEDDA